VRTGEKTGDFAGVLGRYQELLRHRICIQVAQQVADTVPGYDAVGFFGIVAYRDVPKPIVDRLHKEINTVLAMPDVQSHFVRLGMDIHIMTMQEFGDFLKTDAKRWADLVREAKLVF